jgi:hypothetical protein
VISQPSGWRPQQLRPPAVRCSSPLCRQAAACVLRRGRLCRLAVILLCRPPPFFFSLAGCLLLRPPSLAVPPPARPDGTDIVCGWLGRAPLPRFLPEQAAATLRARLPRARRARGRRRSEHSSAHARARPALVWGYASSPAACFCGACGCRPNSRRRRRGCPDGSSGGQQDWPTPSCGRLSWAQGRRGQLMTTTWVQHRQPNLKRHSFTLRGVWEDQHGQKLCHPKSSVCGCGMCTMQFL